MKSEENQVILLVEDSEDDVFLMKRALEQAGIMCPVRTVSDGQEARRYLSGEGEFADRSRFPYPSIIFLDLKLPYMSGFDVLRWRQANPSLPSAVVIVLTSSSETRDLNLAYSLGANSYLVKPPTREQLVDIIKAFQLYWLNHNAVP